MQLTVRPASALIAAAAVLSTGMLAVHPLAPAAADVQRFATQLVTDTAPTPVDWATVMQNANENLTALQKQFEANPFPDVTAMMDLHAGYAKMIADEAQESLKGIQGIWSGYGPAVGLENLLPQVQEFLHNGDYASAYSLINVDMLFDMLNITQPFFNHVPYGSTEMIPGASGIPADMMRHMAAVSEVFADYSTWKNLAESVMSPAIGAMFQAMQSTGDPANAPAQVVDALLNGYHPLNAHNQNDFVGLLNQGSLLDQLLVIIPGKIADALNDTTAGTDVVAPDADPSAAIDALGGLLG